MLTPLQQEFIERRPNSNIVVIPFDPSSNQKFGEVKNEIIALLGEVDVLHRGSIGLGIAGQPEIDIHIPVYPEEISIITAKIEEKFGKPKSVRVDERTKLIKYIDKTMIEIILVNKLAKSWIDGEIFYNYLLNHIEARDEYEKLKGIGEELSIREYYRRKFEFMNKILDKVGIIMMNT